MDMSSLSNEADDFEELDDDNIPAVEIDDFDPAEIEEMDTLFDGHPLFELMAPATKVKFILLLMGIDGEKLPPSDIYNRAGVSHEIWYRYRDDLVEKYNVIEKAGSAGNSPLYRINEDSEIVKQLEQLIIAIGDRKEDWIIEQREEKEDEQP